MPSFADAAAADPEYPTLQARNHIMQLRVTLTTDRPEVA